MSTLAEIRAGWDAAAQRDAMGHILTTGIAWDPDAFYNTGQAEIDAALAHADSLNLRGPRRALALDFGCGVGRLTVALAAYYDRVIGVDIAPAMLAQARAHERIRYQDHIPSGSYDLIYTNLVLQHMPRELAHEYIQLFIGLLHDDGIAIFEIPEGPDYQHPEACLSMWGTPRTEIERIVMEAGGEIVDVDVMPGSSQWLPWRYTVRSP